MTSRQTIYATIRRMKHIWRMWRLMVYITSLEPLHALAGVEETDPVLRADEIRNNALSRNGQRTRIARHTITLGYSKNMDPVSSHETQDLLDSCISAGFLDVQEVDGNGIRESFVTISAEGRKFTYFSYFLKYLLTELEIVFKWYWTIIALVLGAATREIVSLILKLLHS